LPETLNVVISIKRCFFFAAKPYDTSITFNPQPVMVGDSVEIKCDSKGVPDPHSVIMRSGRKISTGKSYIILQVNQSHEGPYTCFAINALGNDSVTENLTVTGGNIVFRHKLIFIFRSWMLLTGKNEVWYKPMTSYIKTLSKLR
jgi:hypothetical protein